MLKDNHSNGWIRNGLMDITNQPLNPLPIPVNDVNITHACTLVTISLGLMTWRAGSTLL